jgi:hypothetical protein
LIKPKGFGHVVRKRLEYPVSLVDFVDSMLKFVKVHFLHNYLY